MVGALLGAAVGELLGASVGVVLGALVGALVGVLVVAVRVTMCLFSWPYPTTQPNQFSLMEMDRFSHIDTPGPPTKEIVTLFVPVMSDGAVHDTCRPPLVVVPLISTT